MSHDNTRRFIAYEYMDVTVRCDNAVQYEDVYENFGWALVERQENGGISHSAAAHHHDHAAGHQVHNPAVNTNVPSGLKAPRW